MENDLIRTFLHVSLSVSVIIVFLSLISPLLRKRYRAGWCYFAWLVISVRLLVPVNISLSDAPIRIQVQNNLGAKPLTAPAEPITYDTAAAKSNPVPLAQGENIFQTAASVTFEQIITVLWSGGVFVFFLIQAISGIRFWRRIKFSPHSDPTERVKFIWDGSTEYFKEKRPGLKISSAVASPMITGLLKPVLILPHENYSHEELNFIFRHELVHYKRGDLWFKLLLTIVNGLHWFNPAVYLMADQAGRDIEMSCDDRVKAGLNEEERALYGQAILDALPVKIKWRIEPMLTTSFGSTKKTIKNRLTNLFDKSSKKKGTAAFFMVLALIITAGGLVAYTPISAASDFPYGMETATVGTDTVKKYMKNDTIQEFLNMWIENDVGENATPIWQIDTITPADGLNTEMKSKMKSGEKAYAMSFTTAYADIPGKIIFAYGTGEYGPYINKLGIYEPAVSVTNDDGVKNNGGLSVTSRIPENSRLFIADEDNAAVHTISGVIKAGETIPVEPLSLAGRERMTFKLISIGYASGEELEIREYSRNELPHLSVRLGSGTHFGIGNYVLEDTFDGVVFASTIDNKRLEINNDELSLNITNNTDKDIAFSLELILDTSGSLFLSDAGTGKEDGIKNIDFNTSEITGATVHMIEGVIKAGDTMYSGPFPVAGKERMTFKLKSIEYASGEKMEELSWDDIESVLWVGFDSAEDDNVLKNSSFGLDNSLFKPSPYGNGYNGDGKAFSASLPDKSFINDELRLTIGNVDNKDVKFSLELTIE